jgi:hypothetical protein
MDNLQFIDDPELNLYTNEHTGFMNWNLFINRAT